MPHPEPSALATLLFLAFGVVVGTYGTIVGAGGGFVIVPVLLLFYGFSAQNAVGTSLAIVFLNAVSGTIAYVRAKRIDYRTGYKFALATLPGAAGGAYLSDSFSTHAFYGFFGAVLLLLALLLVFRPGPKHEPHGASAKAPPRPGWVDRTLVDARGERFEYRFNERGGIIASGGVGFVSSILGIGGGIIHVPLLVFLLGFPAHVATATSHFILAITAGVGCAFHLALGHVVPYPALMIGVGAFGGAQIGGALAPRVQGRALLQLLSLALAAAGIRLLLKTIE